MSQSDAATRYWRIYFWIWLSIIFIGTHLPQQDPVEGLVTSPDKMLHFIAFGGLTFLLIGTKYFSNFFVLCACVASWTVLDEWTQHLLPINRLWSTDDVIAGELGVIAAMTWKNAMNYDSLKASKEKCELVLSKGTSWIQLTLVGILVTIVTFAVVLGLIYLIQGRMKTTISLTLALFVTTGCIVDRLTSLAGIQGQIKPIIKSMVIPMLGSIAIASMAGFLVMHTTLEPLVAVLAVLVIGARVSWHIACDGEGQQLHG